MSDTLVINEIYASLQGESSFAGFPCIFLRTTACPLRCSYCDTAYAFKEGRMMTAAEVLDRIHQLAHPYASVAGQPRLPLIEITGGEPLVQPAVLSLMTRLCDEGFVVLIETSGAYDIEPIDARVRIIMDLKCPGSGEVSRNRWENIQHLKPCDELKFVISTVEDYEWAKEQIQSRRLSTICSLIFSWASPLTPDQQDASLKATPKEQTPISRRELAERLMADALPVRFQVQMHKVIWPPNQRSV